MTTSSPLNWIHGLDDNVWARPSCWNGESAEPVYFVEYEDNEFNSGEWTATFGTEDLARGGLPECLAACQKHEEVT